MGLDLTMFVIILMICFHNLHNIPYIFFYLYPFVPTGQDRKPTGHYLLSSSVKIHHLMDEALLRLVPRNRVKKELIMKYNKLFFPLSTNIGNLFNFL